MIEINLARQLQGLPAKKESFTIGMGLMSVLLCVGIGAASVWWTQTQQQNLERLLQEKHVQTQLLDENQATLGRLNEHQKERQRLRKSIEVMQSQQLGKIHPLALLDGVSRSADGLEMWLDHVQMTNQVVELRGQALALKDIGSFIDALESYQVVTSLPVVEILDRDDQKSGTLFSFMIRFVLGP